MGRETKIIAKNIDLQQFIIMKAFKNLFLLLLLLGSTMASAQSFEVDGLEYEVIGNTNNVAVSEIYGKEYTGNIVIPSTVTYEYKTYTVTAIADDAFEDTEITGVEIPETVTVIDEGAFCDCSKLASIVIPNSVTIVGECAFQGCSSLASITLGSGLTDIKEEAFSYCPALTSVEIPAGVKNIEPYVFGECPAIESIKVEAGNKVYDSRNNCNAIIETSTSTLVVGCKNSVIPSGIKAIGEAAFSGCSKLASIIIPEGVTVIGPDAFCGCSSLTSIELPQTVTFIGGYAFCECSALKSINIPAGVKSIEDGVFSYCSSLESIVIPNSVTSVGDAAFGECESLVSVKLPDGLKVIEDELFYRCTSLANVNIPQGVTSIGDAAFCYCALTEVVIPNSVTKIEGYAFGGCPLTNVTVPESVTTIEESAFEMTPWLDSFADGVVYINNVLYKYKGTMDWNTSIEVKDGTVSIAPDAFYGCEGLVAIKLPNTVTAIGNDAFRGCYQLNDLQIPSSVTSVGSRALEGTEWYENQPDGVIYINNVLYCCKGDMPERTSIDVREGTVSISEDAFMNCYNLTSITIPGSVKVIGKSAMSYLGSVENVTLGEGIEIIGADALSGLSIHNLVIPNSVKSIGEYAFQGCCWLESVTIGAGVEFIDSWAFGGCENLSDVYCLATTVPVTHENVFNEIQHVYDEDDKYIGNMTLYVPAEALNSYKSAALWSNFGTIKALGEDTAVDAFLAGIVITCKNGVVTVCGGEEGAWVAAYSIDGACAGRARIVNGEAEINTGFGKGDVLVVDIAGKAVKMIMQ